MRGRTLLAAALLGGAAAGCGPDPADIAANLESDNPAVREDTAKIARNFDDEQVIAALIGVLEDPSAEVRRNAIESLAELGATEAVDPLIEVLRNDPSDVVRRDAVDALGRLRDPRAVEPLIEYVEERKETRPPLNAIWALGFIGDARALPILSELREHPDPYVAWNANQALRNLKP